MSIPSREPLVYGAVTGYQFPITGTNVSQTGTLARSDIEGNSGSIAASQKLAGAGAIATGTYYYFCPTAGCAAVDFTFLMASHTGTVPTITVYPTLSDNISIKGTATAVTALVDATQATTSLTTLRGERGCIVKMVVPGASSATFTQADYSAL